jgi:hypothetical protein
MLVQVDIDEVGFVSSSSFDIALVKDTSESLPALAWLKEALPLACWISSSSMCFYKLNMTISVN